MISTSTTHRIRTDQSHYGITKPAKNFIHTSIVKILQIIVLHYPGPGGCGVIPFLTYSKNFRAVMLDSETRVTTGPKCVNKSNYITIGYDITVLRQLFGS